MCTDFVTRIKRPRRPPKKNPRRAQLLETGVPMQVSTSDVHNCGRRGFFFGGRRGRLIRVVLAFDFVRLKRD